MLISKKWLSQYIDISDFSMEEIADKITAAGLEVEGIEYGSTATNLVIGIVEECVDHPDSDHLHICKVNDGKQIRQIICGAPNVCEGLKVIVALPGSKLAGGEIKKGVIRGVESDGMLCSLQELGVDPKSLSDAQKAGIEELSEDAVVGDKDVLAYLGLDDIVLDIGLTPNRNDCLAAFAMAKEVGAVLKREVNLPFYEGCANQGTPTKLKVSSISEKCPLYLGKIIREVTIKESPKWMKQRLMASNIKCINNVVDISNLVMLETGQPLHFFDLAQLEKEEIVVKNGITCEYTALDEITYQIEPEDIMITVNDKPVAIGGIMGGDNSKIIDSTKGILIESASFDSVSIRNSSRKFNLNTDASIRNQKNIEPNAPYAAMDRAVQLLIEYADAKGIEETVSNTNKNIVFTEIDVNLPRINTLLGTKFSEEEVMNVLTRLNLQPSKKNQDIHVIIPTYRQDLSIEADIAEEIIRILGFDDLVSTMPVMPDTVGCLTPRQALRRNLRGILSKVGYYEALTYTLTSQERLNDAIMPFDSHIELASPMSEDRKIIRTSILPSLLDAVAYNTARSLKDVALFEISNVYAKDKVDERLAVVLSGNLQKCRWQNFAIEANFYTMKGLVQSILEHLGFKEERINFQVNEQDTKHFHPYQSACVYIGKELFGLVGTIHPFMAKRYGVNDDCVMCELNLEILLKNKASKVKFEPISKYPQVTRDLALLVKDDVQVATIIKAIKKNSPLIQAVEAFDVYVGDHVEKGYKSIALSIIFQSQDSTLKEEEINAIHDKILDTLKNELSAQLRV